MAQNKTNTSTLYYFPTSFSSQKVLFALYEKDVQFKAKLVSLFSGQHNEPWYVKLNPNGIHIPIYKHGEKILVEPAAIIDYIGKTTQESGGHPLVPSLDSELGKDVCELRTRLDCIPVDILTYGVIYHPHLSSSGCQIPGAVQRSMKENFTARLSLLTELATKHPDLRDSYLVKSQTSAHNFDIITDETQVQSQLAELDQLFTDIEKQLQKIKQVGSDISDELWLFGPMFTAADISLAVLLDRLTLLGLDNRYFPAEKCPCICQYNAQVKQRAAYKLIKKQVENLKLTLVWENVKSMSPYMLGGVSIGVAAGVGYYTYKKLQS